MAAREAVWTPPEPKRWWSTGTLTLDLKHRVQVVVVESGGWEREGERRWLPEKFEKSDAKL